jgi:hypothetical protein
MDRYLVISSDGHIGLRAPDYRPYVEAKYRPAFDAALPIQIEATQRMSDYFRITEINEAWRRGRDYELSGAWDPVARDKVLGPDVRLDRSAEDVELDDELVEDRRESGDGRAMGLLDRPGRAIGLDHEVDRAVLEVEPPAVRGTRTDRAPGRHALASISVSAKRRTSSAARTSDAGRTASR